MGARRTRWLAGLAAAALVVVAVVVLVQSRPTVPPEPGISLALAQSRAARIKDLEYELALTVPAARTAPIDGRLTATFTLKDDSVPLVFDFVQPPEQVRGVTAGGRAVDYTVTNGHIVVPARALDEGRNSIEIAFVAGDASLNRQDEFLYALFVPARASLAIPCFDQPDLKARWRLSLDLPADWTAVSNGRQTGRTASPTRVAMLFDRTEPMSTYLFTFAAGRFQMDTAQRGGRTMRMFHRETDAAKVARNRDAIFDLHAAALTWLEDYTTIDYPFGKFDFVLIPSFQFGGMEHPGAIFYNANGLLLEEASTENQRLGRASLIAHETAHMWFGDLVTMRWFNDVWTKEVFANFMAAKIVNPAFPDVNHELRFLLGHYPSAYGVDRTAGANPIRQTLANLHEAGSLYGAIIYQKAPIVMQQLERLLGADVFRDGLRVYLKQHAFANATWPDLIRILDQRTDADLVSWSHAWVEERGRPRIRVEIDAAATPPAVRLTSDDPLGRGLAWPQALTVAAGYATRVEYYDAVVPASGSVSVPLPSKDGAPPAWILPNGRGLGYGDFVLDAANLDALVAAFPRIADPVTRGAALVTLWESMLERRIVPARLLDMALTALPRERVELLLSELLDVVEGIYWRYTPAAERPALAARVEKVLRSGLDRAGTTSTKAAWFNALQSVATTPATLDWLERVWRRTVRIPNLPLAEVDETDLAFALALRGVPNAAAILDEQSARITNPDRQARFAFIRPAVAGDAGERARFFETLKDVNNRRREAWVLTAAAYLHHPLRADESRALIRPALDLVHEIQRTGDIFFPKRWADATLSGYQSRDVAAEVRAYIDALPSDYPQRLRWVLLSAADPLFRAAQVSN